MPDTLTKSDYQRLESKLDKLSDTMHDGFARIGKLEERVTSFMGLAERIETRSQDDIRKLTMDVADHEARLRTLEASTASNKTRSYMLDGAFKNLVIPVLLGALAFLAAYWANDTKIKIMDQIEQNHALIK